MARYVLDQWVPVEQGGPVIETVRSTSAAESLFRRENMNSDTKEIGISSSVGVNVTPKGSAYTEFSATDTEVVLKTRKFTGLLRFADEDLQDINSDAVGLKQREWAESYGRGLDTACIGTIGAANGTTVPFDSIYRTVTTGAAANYAKTAGALTYDQISSLIGKLEAGSFFGNVALIAHPAFKGLLRGLKDTQGRPLFLESPIAGGGDTLFGYTVRWSWGAKTAAVFDPSVSAAGGAGGVAGNPLLVAVNTDQTILGVRSGPESFVIPANTGIGALTDEAFVKMRARRAFVLANASAAAVLEYSVS